MDITTQEEFEEKVLKAEGKVLVDFWAGWCAPCKMMLPTLTSLSGEGFNVVKVNIDKEENAEIAKDYEVRSIPALLVFEAGEIVDSFTGITSKEVLAKALED